MKIKAFAEKNKYALASFAVLALLSVTYGGFENPAVLALRLLVCLGAALFFSFNVKDDERIYFPAFSLLTLISCNTVFLTCDVHILLSLSFFLLALAFAEKQKILSPVFAGFCVLSQPLTALFFVPAILFVLLLKKQKIPAIISAVVSVVAFVVTKLLSNIDFYADQFSSYYLSLHLVHFSTSHIRVLTDYLVASIPLLAVVIFVLIRVIIKKDFLASVATVASLLCSFYGFALSKNLETAIFILIPVFALFVALSEETNLGSSTTFFKNHKLVFLLLVAFVAGYPLVFGQIPYENDLFSKIAFIIFRQE